MNKEKNYRFKLSIKIYMLGLITSLIFASILSLIVYVHYFEFQRTLANDYISENLNLYYKTITERYDKISSTASDVIKTAMFAYKNNPEKTNNLDNFGLFYQSTNFSNITLYKKESKSLKNYHLKEGLNFKILNNDLKITYLKYFDKYALSMNIIKDWFFKFQNIPHRNVKVQTVVNINKLNLSFMASKTCVDKNVDFPIDSLEKIEKNYYYSSIRSQDFTLYSFISKRAFRNYVLTRIYFVVFLIYLTSFLVTMFLILIMNIVFVNKIKTIVKHISTIRNGKLNHRIDLKGNDEISYLAYHINSMAGVLSELIEGQKSTIDRKNYLLKKKLEQEQEINDLIINMTRHSENAELLLNFIHKYLKEKGAERFFHYRMNQEGNAFELLKNDGYHNLPKKFFIASPIIQQIFELYENEKKDEAKEKIKEICNIKTEEGTLHLIDYKSKLIGFLQIEWKNPESNVVLKPILKTLPIIINNIYMRDSLIKTTIELKEANKAKNEFLNVMSHELRTPLNAILGFTQILLRRPENLSEKQLKYIENINVAGNNLLEIINDILDLSKIQSGKREIHISSVNMQEIVKNILVILTPLAKEKNIDLKLKTNIKQNEVYSDEDMIKHIIINLMSNAIKYTKNDGEVILSVKCENEKVNIEVKDTGIGIPKDKLNDIFEPFKRLQKDEYGANIKGTGLGLSIVKEYVDILGGNIKVESEVGVGSSFVVNFPAKKIDFPSTVKEGECDNSILIIENNIEDVELYKSIIKSSYNITTATTLQEGVNYLKDIKPKVIILDLRLPDMTGVYLLNKLHKDERFECVNIIVSSVIKKRNLNNVKYFIQKPIKDVFKFKELIDNLMNS